MTPHGKQTQAEKLASEIADAILTGTLAPGTRLDEQTLADRYAVSRTPVREAIRHLAATGLVEVRPRRSAIVTAITPERLETMFVAMGELEATCARLSALSMTPIERRRLQSFYESMAEFVARDDREGFATANLTFHTLIYGGAHNEIISDFASALLRRLAPFRRAQFRTVGRLPRSHEEHGNVVSAIMASNAAQAHAAMFDHMSLVEDSFERLAAAAAAA